MPTVVYPHSEAQLRGALAASSTTAPEGRLTAQYLAGDYCSGRIWTVAPGEDSLELQVDTDLLITSFGEASDGSGYVLAQGGQLLEVLAVEPS